MLKCDGYTRALLLRPLALCSLVAASMSFAIACSRPLDLPPSPLYDFSPPRPSAGVGEAEARAALLGHYAHYDVVTYEDRGTKTPMKTFVVSYGFTDFVEQGPKIRWQAQAIVRPFMTRGVFDKLAASGCREMLFGIESGSQRVIDRMRKGFRVADAENVVRDAAQAGIDVVANFMVGFPGETDADFAATLAFVEKNARWIRYVNPDQTTTGMAPGTYLWEHWDEFGIVEPDGLNWRTRDGRNTIDIRRGRYERFRKRCKALGVQENPRK